MGKLRNTRKGKKSENDVIKNVDMSNVNMLLAIETVLLTAEDSSLDLEVLEPIKHYLKYIADLQEITMTQALLLSVFVEGSSDGSIVSLSSLARFFDCPKVRVMQFNEDINELIKRKFLRRVKKKYGNDSVGFIVPDKVIEEFNKNNRFVPKSLVANDGVRFMQMVHDLTHLRREEEIDTEQLMEEFEQLLDANANLQYVKRLERLKLPDNSRLIVTHMARCLVLDQRESISTEKLGYLFDDRDEAYYEIHPLEEGEHILMKKNIVEYAGKDDFLNKSKFKLTQAAREKLLKGFSLPKRETSVATIKTGSIVKKSLFFNGEVERQIEELTELLTIEKLTAIQTRLKEKGRRTGFACLFYGAPGTGKTESVLQIAQRTGRDIMQVDMSEIKSKWVGESEQNIKAVFDNYRALCNTCDKTPILLFNEADAILGTRMGRAMSAVDKMNNAIQNIVLQEMETLDGIMIATTNLEKSLDPAFERRFIYKVRFTRPGVKQRKNIWKSMLPALSDDMAVQLASSFDFSGGQIENVARKCDVKSVLYGESSIDEETIIRFCKEESIHKKNIPHIGFV